MLLDQLNINQKGRGTINKFSEAIRDFNDVKIWRKDKDALKPDLRGVPYAFEINKQGGINVKLWDRNKIMRSIEKLVDNRPEIGGVSDVLTRIEDARFRQSQGQPINDDLVSALLGARPEAIKDKSFRDIATQARGKRSAFVTVPIKNIAGFRDLKQQGLAVRIKDVIANPFQQ